MFQPDEKMLKLEIYLIKYEFYLRFYLFLSSEMCKRNQSIKTNQQINQYIIYIYYLV